MAARTSSSRASRALALAAIALLITLSVASGRFVLAAGEEAPKAAAAAAAIGGATAERHHHQQSPANHAAAAGAAVGANVVAAEGDDAPPLPPHQHQHEHQHDQSSSVHGAKAKHHPAGHEAHAAGAHAGKEGAHAVPAVAIEHGQHFAAEKSIATPSASSSAKHHRREGPLASPASTSTSSTSHDHHAPTTQKALFPGGCEPRVPTGNHPLEFSIRCLSPSVALAPGQVVNVNLLFESPFPADVAVAIGTQTTQLVSAESQEPIPADDVYMHHFVTPDTLLVPPPTGQGNVTRATFFVDGADDGKQSSAFSLVVPSGHYAHDARRATNMHLISTVGVGSDEDRLPKLMCVECRCPEEKDLEVTFARSAAGAGLPTGGVICCRDCEAPNVEDRSPRHYQLRYDTIYRELPEESTETRIAPVRLARVDGARGVGERIEYEVPKDPEGKQHVSSYDFTLNDLLEGAELSEPVVLLRCDGHQHMGGECLTLLDASTGDVVCESCPTVGKTAGVVGDELDYVVSMSTVEVSPPRKVAPDAPLRMLSKYSAAERHTGVMSIMFLYYAEDSGKTFSVAEIDAAAAARDGAPANEAAQAALAVSPTDFSSLFPRALSYTSRDCAAQLWQVWANCPPAAASSRAEENAVVCCSMTGALAASRCTCDVVPHAEGPLLEFLTDWQARCTSAVSAWDAYALACHDDGTKGGWRWRNLLAFIGADDQVRALFGDGELMRLLVLLSWGVPVLVMVLSWGVHHAAARAFPAYGALPEAEKYVCLSHLVSAVLFSLQLAPLTTQGVKMLFGPNFQENAGGITVPLLIGISYSHAAIYVAEGIYRGTARPNWVLMSHHILFFSLAPVMIKYMSMLAFKTAMTIDMFVTFEAGLFALLAARRLGASPRLALNLGRFGIGLYAASRVAQSVILFSLFKGSHQRIGATPAYWMLAFVAGSLTLIQTFTFFIYAPVLAKLRAEVAEGGSGGGGGGGGGGVIGKGAAAGYSLAATSVKGAPLLPGAVTSSGSLPPTTPSPSSSPEANGNGSGGSSGNGSPQQSSSSLRRLRLGSASSAASLDGGSGGGGGKKW